MSSSPYPLPSSLRTATPPSPLATTTAHTLFLDIVGFARLSARAQATAQNRLNEIVRNAPVVRRAVATAGGVAHAATGNGQVAQTTPPVPAPGRAPLFRPTGDGMAILFWNEAREPIQCAREITDALRLGDLPEFGSKRSEGSAETLSKATLPPEQLLRSALKLRMGVHSGPVTLVQDVNGQTDVSGDGIIRAQRVMDFGDAGHILVSDATVAALGALSPFARRLTDLGLCRAKHDVLLHVYNFHSASDDVAPWGNPAVPPRLSAQAAARIVRDQRTREAWRRDVDEERARPFRASLAIAAWSFLVIGGLGLTLWQLEPVRSLAREAYPRFASFTPRWGFGGAAGGAETAKTNKTGRGASAARPAAASGDEPGQRKNGIVYAPDFSGQLFEAARKTAKKHGIMLKKSPTFDYSDARPADEIYLQTPPAGAELTPANRNVYVRVFRKPLPAVRRGRDDDAPRRFQQPTGDGRADWGRAGRSDADEGERSSEIAQSGAGNNAAPEATHNVVGDGAANAFGFGGAPATPPIPPAATTDGKGSGGAQTNAARGADGKNSDDIAPIVDWQ